MKTERLNPGKAIIGGVKGRDVKFEVKLQDGTMRLDVADMARLFATDRRTVRGHVKDICKEAALKQRAAGRIKFARPRPAVGAAYNSLFPSLCIKLLRELPARPHCDNSLPA